MHKLNNLFLTTPGPVDPLSYLNSLGDSNTLLLLKKEYNMKPYLFFNSKFYYYSEEIR